MAGLTDRVTNILKSPKTEWPVIEAESTDVGRLYREYIVILAAIPAVCGYLGLLVIGLQTPFGTVRTSLGRGFVNMVVEYVLSLVAVYVTALIVDKLAPTFQSRPSQVQAVKLVAYSMTASWVGGVLSLIPLLGVLRLIAGLYSIYLFYLGVPVMMKTPSEKVLPYMAVSVVVTIVVMILIGLVSTALTPGVGYGSL